MAKLFAVLSLALLGLTYANTPNLMVGAFHGLGFTDFTAECEMPQELANPSDLWELLNNMLKYSKFCKLDTYATVLESLIPEAPLDHLLEVKLKQASTMNLGLKYAIDAYETGLNIGAVLSEVLGMSSPSVLKFLLPEFVELSQNSEYPTAVFHGLGDSCSYPGMSQFTSYIGKATNNYATCIEIGSGTLSSWLESFSQQTADACKNVLADEKLKNGFNIVGLSQGSLVGRAIAESCGVKVISIVTLGGPHMGVATIPNCHNGWFCDIVNDLVGLGVYSNVVQDHIGPAGYYKDQYKLSTYLEKSNFLANFNNEKAEKNSVYTNNIQALEKLVLIMFTEDNMIDPKESAWFGFYADNSRDLLNFNETTLFNEEWLGIQALYTSGKIVFEWIQGEHLQMSYSDLDQKVIPYLL